MRTCPLRHAGVLFALGLLSGAFALGVAGSPADPNLPADFRRQILELERQKNAKADILGMEYSDPVPVLVHDSARPGSAEDMSAVLFSHGLTEKGTGSPYLMIVQGAALFSKGALVRMIGTNDKTIEWIRGKPSVAPDSPAERAEIRARRLTDAERLFDPVRGPMERRAFRRQIWNQYGPAFEAMKLEPSTVGQLVDRLETVDEAQQKAEYLALEKGIDPFSPEMNMEIGAEKQAAQRNLEAVLGVARTDRLKYLAAAPGYYRMVMANGADVQSDLQDAGLPMTDEQIRKIGMICEDVCDPKRNPDFARLSRQSSDPATGISPAWQEVLRRAALLLQPAQIEVMKLNLSDRSSISKNFHDPVAQARWARRRVMREYGPALLEMKLPADVTAKAKDLLLQRRDVRQAMAEELTALLGAQGYRQMEHLRDILPLEKNIRLNEATDCRDAGCDLTAEQVRLLAEASWAARESLPKRPPGELREETDPATGLSARATIVVARAAAFLSSRQLETAKIYYRDQAVMMNRIAAEQPPSHRPHPPPVPAKAS